MNESPLVAVVMGSSSDWPTMSKAVEVLPHFGVPHEVRVLSAHRMPDEMFGFAESAKDRGLRAIIAGAGGAAHLPGMLAAKTTVPVLGVPVPSRHLGGRTRCTRSCRCRPAYLSRRLRSARPARPTPRCSPSHYWLRRPRAGAALDAYRRQRHDDAAAAVLPPDDSAP